MNTIEDMAILQLSVVAVAELIPEEIFNIRHAIELSLIVGDLI